MKDIFGNEVAIGDTVAFVSPFSKGLMTGKIVKFTPKGVKIGYYDPHCSDKRYEEKFEPEGHFTKKVM